MLNLELTQENWLECGFTIEITYTDKELGDTLMAKPKWTKEPNSYYKKETTEYRGFRLEIQKEEDEHFLSRLEKWYGKVYDSNGNLVKTSNGYVRFKFSSSVVEARKRFIEVIDRDWNYYSGKEPSNREKQIANEDALKKRNYILQNIHWYSEMFGDDFQVDAENLHTVISFALDNFDEFENLFKLKKELADTTLDHCKKYDRWLSLPAECRQQEVFSHHETQKHYRTYRDKSSYWGYDDIRTETTYDTVPIYTNNSRYVQEPRLPDQYPLLKKIRESTSLLREKASNY